MAQVRCPNCGGYNVRTYGPVGAAFWGFVVGVIVSLFCSASVGAMLYDSGFGDYLETVLGSDRYLSEPTIFLSDPVGFLMLVVIVIIIPLIILRTIIRGFTKSSGYGHHCVICQYQWNSKEKFGPPTDS